MAAAEICARPTAYGASRTGHKRCIRGGMILKNFVFAIVFGGGAVAGCGGTSTGTSSTATAGGITADDFAAQYCALMKPCCDGSKLPSVGCAASIKRILPGSFDGAAGDTCLAALRGAATTAPTFCDRESGLSSHPACSRLSADHGSIPAGGTCTNATSNAQCDVSPEGAVGCIYGSGRSICQVQLLGDVGASPCAYDAGSDGSIPSGASLTGDVLPKAYYCDRSRGLHCNLTTSACVTASPVGGDCQYNDYECAAPGYCDTEAKMCKARVAVGAACKDFRSCAVGARCGAVAGDKADVCVALIENGSACTRNVDCASRACSKSGVCATAFGENGADLFCRP